MGEGRSAFNSADHISPTHLVEAPADVVGRAALLTAGNGDVGRDVLTVDQDPSHRTTDLALVVVPGALLGFVQPVLQGPDVCLFLSVSPSNSWIAADERVRMPYLFLALLVLAVRKVPRTKRGDTGNEAPSDLEDIYDHECGQG